MKLSKMGIKTSKSIGSEELFITEMLLQSGQLKRISAGVFAWGTMLVKAKQKLENIIRKHLDSADCFEALFCLLQARNYWDASGRWDKYIESGSMYTTKGRTGEFALSATAEEMSMEFMRSNIQSYKDLGVTVYQIATKFRDELRAQGGLLKSREFMMMDAYSFDESKEKMVETFNKMAKAYENIFDELGLRVKAVKSVNDMGGKIAWEFMCFDEIYGQDTILYDEEHDISLNSEVLELEDEELKKEILADYVGVDFARLKKAKAIEMGHIFQNDQVYSKMMKGTFINRNGKQDYYWNGCYGIGISRAIQMLIVKSFEKYGRFVWEDCVAAYKVNIIVLDNEQIQLEGLKLYEILKNKGIECVLDDRQISIGAKLKDNELYGIRYNIILGKNYLETGKFEYLDRKTNEKREVTKDKILEMEF